MLLICLVFFYPLPGAVKFLVLFYNLECWYSRTLTICLLLVYFVSDTGCHCFDLFLLYLDLFPIEKQQVTKHFKTAISKYQCHFLIFIGLNHKNNQIYNRNSYLHDLFWKKPLLKILLSGAIIWKRKSKCCLMEQKIKTKWLI